MAARLATAIISAGRPENVPAMARHAQGLRPVWLVPRADVTAYRRAGASRVEGVPGGLVGARNRALDIAAAAGAWCLQLDDDLRAVRQVTGEGARPGRVTLAHAAGQVAATMDATGARLGGVAPTANAYFSRRTVTPWGFVIGSLCVLVPGPERFDARLPLKEDWDMTCQHLAAYGHVARRDDLLADFRHYSASGGCTRYRTGAREDAAVSLLLQRWPGHLRPHPRRAHELALRPAPVQKAG